jgi:hypothetical protein
MFLDLAVALTLFHGKVDTNLKLSERHVQGVENIYRLLNQRALGLPAGSFQRTLK